jgi:hypothetical protein
MTPSQAQFAPSQSDIHTLAQEAAALARRLGFGQALPVDKDKPIGLLPTATEELRLPALFCWNEGCDVD